MKPTKPESPCIRNCCLDPDDICLGCGRTLEEIIKWQSLSAQDQQKVIERSERRRQKQ